MICLICGRYVDEDLKACPYCGAPLAPETVPSSAQKGKAAVPPLSPQRGREKKSRSTGVFALCLVAAVCFAACLMTLLSLRRELQRAAFVQETRFRELGETLDITNRRLNQIDETLATVQEDAYEALASKSITISKDLTPLVGAVEEGKYNRMFIVEAKGNLNLNSSFDWQKYNEATGGWVSVVFTGEATSNTQYGLRLENGYVAAEEAYQSTLWANGITKAAEGTYRCVITDGSGISRESSEAIVAVEAA